MSELEDVVKHQAEMQSLWIKNPTATEVILMAALRHLHALIEDDPHMAKICKEFYWDLESDL